MVRWKSCGLDLDKTKGVVSLMQELGTIIIIRTLFWGHFKLLDQNWYSHKGNFKLHKCTMYGPDINVFWLVKHQLIHSFIRNTMLILGRASQNSFSSCYPHSRCWGQILTWPSCASYWPHVSGDNYLHIFILTLQTYIWLCYTYYQYITDTYTGSRNNRLSNT